MRKLMLLNPGPVNVSDAVRAAMAGADWCARPDLAAVEQACVAHPNVGALVLVHHETTTGLLNDVAAVGALAHARGLRFLLDSVSGLGGEELDMSGWHVDAAASTANK